MLNIKHAVDMAGGAESVANKCGVTVRAVYKWISNNSLPRTEYSGETEHAKKIASGCGFTAEQLLNDTKPTKQN